MHEHLLIAAALCGLHFNPRERAGLFGEGDDNTGGGGGEGGKGGGGEKPAAFSQEQVNALLAKERKTIEAKAAESAKALEAKIAELSGKIKEAEDAKQLEGKGPKEAEILKLQQTLARFEGDLKSEREAKAALEKKLGEAVTTHRTYRAREVVSQALVEKGAVKSGKALAQATALFLSETEAEITEAEGGKLSIAFTIDGRRYEDPKVAAQTWLQSNDHFLASAGGGSGTKAPTGAGPRRNVPLSDLSEAELLQLAAEVDLR